jgi:hypothetical protein
MTDVEKLVEGYLMREFNLTLADLRKHSNKEWVEITKGECQELLEKAEGHWLEYGWLIDAKLQEKNT